MRICIVDAKAVAKKRDLQGVVVIGVDRKGTVFTATWADTKSKCWSLGRWIDGLVERGLSVWPWRTLFGWGNKGVPVPLTPGEVDGMSVAHRRLTGGSPPPPGVQEEVWTTRDGLEIPVGEMGDTHVRNALRMILRKRRLRAQGTELMFDDTGFEDLDMLSNDKGYQGDAPYGDL